MKRDKWLLVVYIGEIDCVEESYRKLADCHERLNEMIADRAGIRKFEIHKI
ncbi:hypothetical protein [Edaphovirga cremea]|uniref:hypothetical protein n=1 Tax=Edaphovirga cremea TaxID=2267246 RepID=UPI00398941E3